MADLMLLWRTWERAGGLLAAACRQDMHDRVFAFDRGASNAEKSAMMQQCPVYPQAACLPFWASEGRGIDDPRIVGAFQDAKADERQMIVCLRVSLEQWQAARLCSE